jgi:hypothetical protein
LGAPALAENVNAPRALDHLAPLRWTIACLARCLACFNAREK